MTQPDKHRYKTISTAGNGDFRDRGSKFLAYAWPVSSLAEIKEHLTLLKKEHPKASHFCYAYRLGYDATIYRANDDGEPSGSAGKPILGQIDSLELSNVLIVVVRYFGGSLLGVPGLINAYKTATLLALKAVPLVEKNIEQVYQLNFDYPVMGEVLYHLKQNQCTELANEQGLFCSIRVGIPLSNLTTVLSKLKEINSVEIKEITGS